MKDRSERDLKMGTEYPYDGERPEVDWAHRAARGIARDLCDRGGIKHEMGRVDEAVRRDIVDAHAAIIRRAPAPEAGVPEYLPDPTFEDVPAMSREDLEAHYRMAMLNWRNAMSERDHAQRTAPEAGVPVAYLWRDPSDNLYGMKCKTPEQLTRLDEATANGEMPPLYLAAPVAAQGWLPIESAPKDGTDILVLLDVASVHVVHIAWWRKEGDLDDGTDEDVGWWSYVTNSVSQEKLEGYREPLYWMPLPAPPPGCGGK